MHDHWREADLRRVRRVARLFATVGSGSRPAASPNNDGVLTIAHPEHGIAHAREPRHRRVAVEAEIREDRTEACQVIVGRIRHPTSVHRARRARRWRSGQAVEFDFD
jgi:hypothetical protein